MEWFNTLKKKICGLRWSVGKRLESAHLLPKAETPHPRRSDLIERFAMLDGDLCCWGLSRTASDA